MAITPAPQTNPPQTLSFPALTFAKLSPSPFLLAHLQSPTPQRPNGRSPHEFRSPTAHTGSLTHASGSAVIRVGDTAVVCGVRGEILLAKDVPDWRVERGSGPRARRATGTAKDPEETEKTDEERRKDRKELASLGLLVPNLELSTGCSPAHLPGNPPSTLAQSLSQRVLTLLHIADLVDIEELKIWYTAEKGATKDGDGEAEEGEEGEEEEAKAEVKAFWTLYIDILFISLDGNAFDAALGAVIAALRDTKLPRAWWDVDREMVLCDDRVSEARGLQLWGFPVAASFAVFVPAIGRSERQKGGQSAWVLADPDDFEEGLCAEGVTVVVDERKGAMKVLRIEKGGGGFVGVTEMEECVRLAGERWREWKDVLGALG